MRDDYKEWLKKWMMGLYDEIEFWKNTMETRGGKRYEMFKDNTQKNRKFTLEEDLPKAAKSDEVKFVDIGSGPFSRCGTATDKVNLKTLAVDPLADVYKTLKKEYGIDNGVNLETGFVELLDRKFPSNTFDIVHMSNSLDHCFDPVFGIYQLLNICKIGGKVILRHAENEAAPYYMGLHQWNLSLHNEEKSFVIWRPEIRFDICELFTEYADIYLYPDIENEIRDWIYNKVVMVKKKDIEIPENDFYDDFLSVMYDFMVDTLLYNVYFKTGDNKNMHNRLVKDKLESLRLMPESLKKKLQDERIEKVAIYGFGIIGKALYDLLYDLDIEVACVIDRSESKYKGIKSVPLKDFQDTEDISRIIVAVAYDYDNIVLALKEQGGIINKIVSIEEFVKIPALKEDN